MYGSVIDAFRQLQEEGKEPNFLFMGGSLLHVESFNAFVEKMKVQGRRMCGVACDVTPPPYKRQFDESYITSLDSEDFIFLSGDKDFSYTQSAMANYQDLFRIWQGMKGVSTVRETREGDKPLYCLFQASIDPPVAAWATALQLSKDLRLVHLEEGIGAYTHDYEVQRSHAYEKSFVKRLKGAVWDKAYELFYKKRHEFIHERISEEGNLLFDKESSQTLALNEYNARLMAHAFENLAARRSVPKVDYSNTIVLTGTELFEYHDLFDLEVEFFAGIIEMAKRYGYEVMVRPHPRVRNYEKYRMLDARIDEHCDVPLECLLLHADSKPLATIGMMSSSQVFAQALCGVPCITITDFFMSSNAAKEFPIGFLKVIDDFRDAESYFSDVVTIPKNEGELNEVLAELNGS